MKNSIYKRKEPSFSHCSPDYSNFITQKKKKCCKKNVAKNKKSVAMVNKRLKFCIILRYMTATKSFSRALCSWFSRDKALLRSSSSFYLDIFSLQSLETGS